MSLDACLPADLRGPTTTITRLAAGLSGAGVYRVEAGGRTFVLKVASEDEPAEDWRRRREIQEAAARAGVAPAVIHVDEARRAVTSAFVADQGFVPRLFDPRSRAGALALLGRTLRAVHDLPVPAGAAPLDVRALLGGLWSGPLAGFAVPGFAAEAVRRVVAAPRPDGARAPALCHNDPNPTNLALDGERLVLLDWDTAAPNDPLYDLAAVSVFLRLPDPSCAELIAAHDRAPVAPLPAAFAEARRRVATFCGAMFLQLARRAGHPGDGAGTLDTAIALTDVYQRRRAGSLDIASAEGQWAFGLALLREAVTTYRPEA